ncbi:MAG: alpha-E domain-containing protein [Gammaproteobacteria bacterium]|nr:alpha-E domain-containing protein [Gammaproteobacteria bacterium]
MLSRVAERMYWFGRYCERVENTARLISVYSNLLLDLPLNIKNIWGDLIVITGCDDLFFEKFKNSNERNVIKFLLTDKDNPGSLICNINAARENARTTREIIPTESWEKINELYLYVQKNSQNALKQNARFKIIGEIISYCHQMTGLLFGTMSHGQAYNFIRIGRNLERADMTSRILDVGCVNLLQEQENIPDEFDDILWMNVLRSLSGFQMYRQHVQDRVNGEDVVNFLLKNQDFPRSVSNCLMVLERCMANLPDHDHPLREVTHSQRVIKKMDPPQLIESGLHEFIDEMQINFAQIHAIVGQTWFGHEISQQQEQSA